MKLYSQFSLGVLINPLVAKTLMDFIGHFIGIKYKFRPFGLWKLWFSCWVFSDPVIQSKGYAVKAWQI